MPRHNLKGVRAIVTQDVAEYRAVIAKEIRSTDVVLEVGCAGGLTTARIGKACQLAIGIDPNVEPVCKDMQRKLARDNVRFETMDGFDIASVTRLEQEVGGKFDVIFLDISGNRALATMTPLLDTYEKVFGERCRLFCVKNYKLYRLLWNYEFPAGVIGAHDATRQQLLMLGACAGIPARPLLWSLLQTRLVVTGRQGETGVFYKKTRTTQDLGSHVSIVNTLST
ncbi:hypothetical protein CYMTET_28745 [Cymbomonas tetramitiformis]|uniref:Methyltransferase domain-containing protein n=1 Tax=Cymbomonas tetramitiformis TaxID=36881 RepID=A0AAE0KVM7_9CHLO|nr:hypothetical protein CYMTET_28745 [Cymbomonas tetramitiformis]